MKFIKKHWNKLVLLSYAFFVPAISFAQNNDGKLTNPLGPNGVTSIPAFIKNLLTGVIKIGIPVVALAIIYSGFLFVQARGNSEKLGKAKDALLYTLIGAAILLGSWAIATLISDTVLGFGA